MFADTIRTFNAPPSDTAYDQLRAEFLDLLIEGALVGQTLPEIDADEAITSVLQNNKSAERTNILRTDYSLT